MDKFEIWVCEDINRFIEDIAVTLDETLDYETWAGLYDDVLDVLKGHLISVKAVGEGDCVTE